MISTAFILAAGLGTRMQPWTDLYPKPMLTFGSTPILLLHLEQLFSFGVRHFLVNAHHLSHKLLSFLLFHFEPFSARGARLTMLEEEDILGTGGALFQAKEHLSEAHFFLVNSDILHRIDLQKVASFHESHEALATLVLKRTTDPSWKRVAMGQDGKLSVLGKNRFIENSDPMSFGFTGIHVISRKIFSYCLEKKYLCIVNDLYPEAVRKGETILGVETNEYWKDIGSPEQYAQAHRDLLQGIIS